jgi:hypothetical protein
MDVKNFARKSEREKRKKSGERLFVCERERALRPN